MNRLMLDPNTALVEARQLPMMRAPERQRINPVPIRLRHVRTLGGDTHDVTLDTRRRGVLESTITTEPTGGKLNRRSGADQWGATHWRLRSGEGG